MRLITNERGALLSLSRDLLETFARDLRSVQGSWSLSSHKRYTIAGVELRFIGSAVARLMDGLTTERRKVSEGEYIAL
jgi:hypothetical protein